MTTNSYETVELGDRVDDGVTGFTGIVTAITSFLNGCRRIQVTPRVNPDNSYQRDQWFDEPQLILVERKAYLPPPPAVHYEPDGGDRPDCPPR